MSRSGKPKRVRHKPARLRCPILALTTIGLHSGHNQANWDMASVKRAAAAVAAILVREGVDYAQSKAVFKAARERAGLRASPEHRGGVDRLTVEEELRFLDQAYAQDGRTGLMLQTLLETGARASELVQLRVEDVSLIERVVTDPPGQGREASGGADPARPGPTAPAAYRRPPRWAAVRQPSARSGAGAHMLTRQRVGQIVRDVAVLPDQQARLSPSAAPHGGDPAARAGHGYHRPTALPRPRKHHHHPALCRNNGRHAPAPVRPAD